MVWYRNQTGKMTQLKHYMKMEDLLKDFKNYTVKKLKGKKLWKKKRKTFMKTKSSTKWVKSTKKDKRTPLEITNIEVPKIYLKQVKPILKKNDLTIIISDTLENIGERYYIKATVSLCDLDMDERIQVNAYAREEETKKRNGWITNHRNSK